jgi:hypothetical protein
MLAIPILLAILRHPTSFRGSSPVLRPGRYVVAMHKDVYLTPENDRCQHFIRGFSLEGSKGDFVGIPLGSYPTDNDVIGPVIPAG